MEYTTSLILKFVTKLCGEIQNYFWLIVLLFGHLFIYLFINYTIFQPLSIIVFQFSLL